MPGFIIFCPVYSYQPVVVAKVVLPEDMPIADDKWNSRFSLLFMNQFRLLHDLR